MNDIKSIVEKEKSTVIRLRQALHQIPERGFQEVKTAGLVAKHLQSIPGLAITTGMAGTGVMALLDTGKPGKTLLLRADMDALPIQEQTGLAFASTHDGVMHACGHDVHMAMLLTAAGILSRLTDRMTGHIKFMFQPAEEGPGGASPMIEAGILKNPDVDYALACHVWPNLPAGTLGIKPGVIMAAGSTFKIEIFGRGGHGAMPHTCVDPLDTAVQVVNALQRVVSRKLNPLTPSVVSIGTFHAGQAVNIIPDKAVLTGTTRTFSKEIDQTYPSILEPVIKGVCDSMGATYKFSYKPGYPALENDPDMVQKMKKTMARVVPETMIREPESTMGAEDFSFILEKVKGCFFLLGTGDDTGVPLHNPRFTLDESLMLTGVETLVRAGLDLLGSPD